MAFLFAELGPQRRMGFGGKCVAGRVDSPGGFNGDRDESGASEPVVHCLEANIQTPSMVTILGLQGPPRLWKMVVILLIKLAAVAKFIQSLVSCLYFS